MNDDTEYHVVMGVCCAVNLDAPDHNEADKAAIDLWAAIHKVLKPICRSWLVSIATEEVEDEEEGCEGTD